MIAYFREVVVCLVLVSFCPTLPANILRDQRQELSPDAALTQMVGRVEGFDHNLRLVSTCSGALVGPDLLLTNAHCVTDPTDQVLPTIAFMAGFHTNRFTVASEAVFVWKGQRDTYTDWALVRLASRIGERQGFFNSYPATLTEVTSAPWQKQISIAGFNRDFRNGLVPTLEHGGSFWGVDVRGLMNNCSYIEQGSGSPLFVQLPGKPNAIVAVAAAQDLGGRFNAAVPATLFHQQLETLRENTEGLPADLTAFQLCNRTSQALNSVLIYQNARGAWQSPGAVKLAAHSCREWRIREKDIQGVYLYANNETREWTGTRPFCVEFAGQSDEPADADCPAGTYKRNLIEWKWESTEKYKEFRFWDEGKVSVFRIKPTASNRAALPADRSPVFPTAQ